MKLYEPAKLSLCALGTHHSCTYSIPPCIGVSSVDDINLRFYCFYFRWAGTDEGSHKIYMKRDDFYKGLKLNSTRYTEFLPCRRNQADIFSGV
jgi:hypothetical protein